MFPDTEYLSGSNVQMLLLGGGPMYDSNFDSSDRVSRMHWRKVDGLPGARMPLLNSNAPKLYVPLGIIE